MLPLLVVAAVLAVSPAIAGTPSPPVFYRDVLPVLQRHCQVCHRAGEIAPMPFTTWNEARPWARAIEEAVTLRKMPPWFANPKYGHFANNPSLTDEEIAVLRAWAENGAREGSVDDAPRPVDWPSGWNIEPDIILSMPQPFRIPAKATIDYQYLILPTHFYTDRWIRAAEIRPSNRAVVHHAVLYVREPGSSWLRGVAPGVMYSPARDDTKALLDARQTKADILAVYTPGSGPMVCPAGMAKKVSAGSDLVLQFHYTSRDKDTEDQTDIGITMLEGTPSARILTLQMGSDNFVIPAGERDYRTTVSGTMPRDALLLSMFPHMHLRGSEFEFQLISPGRQPETLLDVKPFDFYWQLSYELAAPRLLRRGDRLAWTGHFNNSADNPNNPDPAAEVHWGEQSWQEMMIGFFDVAVEPDVDKAAFFAARYGAK